MHLDAGGGDGEAVVGAPRLGDRDHQFGVAHRGFVAAAPGVVERRADGVAQRPHGLGPGPHVHQHPPHVGVADDGDRAAARVVDRLPLDALAGPVDRRLVGALGDGEALDRHVEARRVHHREHAAHPLHFAAEKDPLGAAVVAVAHDRGGAGHVPHLVLQRDDAQVVAPPRRALRIGQEFGDDEQRDPLRPGRRAGGARKHQVDHVPAHVLVSVGDEDLGAGDPPAAVGGRGAGGQRAYVGSRAGFGQVHRPRPFAGGEFRQVERLHGVVAMRLDGLDRALGEHRPVGEGHVRRLPHFRQRAGQRMPQPHAAIGRVGGDRAPPRLHPFGVGFAEAVGGPHRAVVEPRALFVARPVERRQHLAGEPGRLVEDLADEIGGQRIQAVEFGEALEAHHVLEHEAHVIDGRGVACRHVRPPVRRFCRGS